MEKLTTTVQKRYTITIPSRVRKALSIDVGDKLLIEMEKEEFKVKPIVKSSLDSVKKTHGIVRVPKGTDIKKILKEPELGMVD